MLDKPQPVISLLTDFGLHDPYVGIMKGVMLGICPEARFIDLTHLVPPQDVSSGAYRLGVSWSYFPQGTVHLAVVDPGVGSERLPLAVQAGGHLFVAPDNGLLESALKIPGAVVHAATNTAFHLNRKSHTFHGRDVFAPVAAWLASGTSIEKVGPPVLSPVRLRLGMVRPLGGGLEGEILDIDVFGNLITNLNATEAVTLLEEGRPLTVGKVQIVGLSQCYADVDVGEFVVLIGSTGRVEISVRGGSAAQVLGARVGERVRLGCD